MTLNCDTITYAMNRQLISAQLVSATGSAPQLVEDIGKMAESCTIKGVIKTHTDYDLLLTVCKTWHDYGTIKLTYTWADTTTTLYEGFVDNYSCTNSAGNVDLWDFGFTLSVGEER
jgi:hypothetical protein